VVVILGQVPKLGPRLESFEQQFDVAVATHQTIDLVVHPQVYKLKRDMGK